MLFVVVFSPVIMVTGSAIFSNQGDLNQRGVLKIMQTAASVQFK